MWTDDPVRDAENVQDSGRRAYSSCGICGTELIEGNAVYYDDTSYSIDGMDICECCIDGYLHSKRRGAPCV